jgi:predicted RNA-binding protein YlxR (DUF448 family)
MLARMPTDELDNGARKVAAGSERLCAASGTVRPVADMIRFVLSPEGVLVADLKRRLPGRGVWVTATREALRTAIARKAFARSFKGNVAIPSDFVEKTEQLMEQAVLAGLAVAHKAGRVAIGFARAEAALARDRVVALLHASDAAPSSTAKLDAASRRRMGESPSDIAVIGSLASAQLDLALGRSNVVHAALLAGPESESFLGRAGRLDRFRTGGSTRPLDAHRKAEEQDRNG